jgi:bifunctional non-homologous end joining protein LigD
VSAPLRWDELLAEESADRWTVRTLPRRLAALGEDPWADYVRVKQRLTAAMRRAVDLPPPRTRA